MAMLNNQRVDTIRFQPATLSPKKGLDCESPEKTPRKLAGQARKAEVEDIKWTAKQKLGPRLVPDWWKKTYGENHEMLAKCPRNGAMSRKILRKPPFHYTTLH